MTIDKCKFMTFCSFLLALSLLAPMSLVAQQAEERIIEKSYPVNADATLAVENERGNIQISSWDKPQIDIMVKVIVKGDDRDFLRKRVDEIKLHFSPSKERVEVRTEIGEQGWWSWLWGQQDQVEVHYTIFMPLSGSVDLVNDYGDITLDALEGNAQINCDYGSLHIGELLGRSEINLDYSSASTIDYARSLEMNADYSKITIGAVERLELNADYSTLDIGEVDRLHFNGDYGSLAINCAGSIDANVDYLTFRIGVLSGKLEYNGDYGSLKIGEVTPEFDQIMLKADYVSISMGIHSHAAFRLEGEESYTSLKIDEEIALSEGAGDGISSSFTGHFLHPKAASKIAVNMSYGKLKLTVLVS